jgi:hypothetical protein
MAKRAKVGTHACRTDEEKLGDVEQVCGMVLLPHSPGFIDASLEPVCNAVE